MKKVNELNALLKENGKEEADNIEFEQYASKIIIKDNDAESKDEEELFEGYGAYEAYDFLKANDLLK